ncbi:MAG: SGNH/GDSL hydrolase family protein [Rhodospirillales bacterium]|nr:SGNH/GDSL hydrolase family protein [Rhodospirillales bacterium]
MTSNKKPTTLKLRLSALVFTVVIIFATLELFSQVIYQTREDIANFFHVGDLLNLSNRLDPYEMAVPGDAFHWVLRPGYSADRSAVAELKKAQGKELGAQAFSADQNETGRSVSGITVNQSGFRGEALRDLEKFPRVLMLGDSVTFGLGTETYPHVVAGELLEKNIQVEIINGGVEGYGVRNLLKEVPRYRDLSPKVVTVMIGWNDIYDENLLDELQELPIKTGWLLREAWRAAMRLSEKDRSRAIELYQRQKTPDRHAAVLEKVRSFEPRFLDEVITLIDKLQAMGARVALITLPGLYSAEVEPDATALAIGHLPAYTANPFVLAELTARYNAALREIAERPDVYLFDAAEWSREALSPRREYFLDSVHLNERGLRKLGVFFAERLQQSGALDFR